MTLDVYCGRKTTKQQQSSCDLENEVQVTKTYPGKSGEIPSPGARDMVSKKICHADAKADTDIDTNKIRTETNISPSPLVGGHNFRLMTVGIIF